MEQKKILLVDDEAMIRLTLCKILEQQGFSVTVAGNVAEALKLISQQHFDLLLSDLHMPGHGDGLTVVSAMRHANPEAATMLFTAFPAMEAATHAIALQADEILVKPMTVAALVDSIKHRLEKGPVPTPVIESVAQILQRTTTQIIKEWLKRVHAEDHLMAIPLSDELRSEHLPQLFRDLVNRLNSAKALGSKELKSSVASKHGLARLHQGYTAVMMVEESRILQVSIFDTLQQNLATIDFSVLLVGVMKIADEVDCQLGEAMRAYVAESDEVPAAA